MNYIDIQCSKFLSNNFIFDKIPLLLISSKKEFQKINVLGYEESDSVWRIFNHEQLLHKTKEIKKTINYQRFVKPPIGLIKNLISGLKIDVKVTELEFSLSKVIHDSPPTASKYPFPNVIIIYQNEISIKYFAEFLTLFKGKSPDTIPKIVFVAKELDSSLELLGSCQNKVNIYSLSPAGQNDVLTEISPQVRPIDTHNKLVEMFFLEADGYQNNLLCTQENKISEYTIKLMDSLVELRSFNKYTAQQKVNQIVSELNFLDKSKLDKTTLHNLLTIKSIVNLWFAYINESGKEKLQESIAFADKFKLDLLKAQALKCSILISGYSSLTAHSLKQAKDIFDNLKHDDYSAMTQNNINVNNIYLDRINVEELTELSDFVNDELYHLRRTTSFHSNAGIGLLLNNNIDQATEYFQRSIGKNATGPAVNKLTSEVNFLVSRFMNGENPNESIAINLISRIERQIPRKFNYHITTLYSNLLGIYKNNKEISSLIKEKLRAERYMDYDKYINNHFLLSQYIMANYPSSKAKGISRLPGPLGNFAIDHGFLLATHVYYR